MMPLARLVDLLSRRMPGRVIADAAHLPAYGADYWGQRGTPGIVVCPVAADDVAMTVQLAAEFGVPVVPRGAGTNVSGGFVASPERVLLDLRSLDRVLHIDRERLRATVQPGVLNGALQTLLAPHGLCFSPDPASRALSTIGGNIMENAGGPQCLKYGVTVNHIEAVTCVLADGTTLRFAADDAGPDMLGLLVGSEGTLGIVTEAEVRLRPLPDATHTLLCVFDSVDAAAEVVAETLAAGIVPAAMELMDRTAIGVIEAFAPSGYPTDAEAMLLIDVDGTFAEAAYDLAAVEQIARTQAREVRRAETPAARDVLWRGRILGAQAIAASGRGYMIGDTTVPRDRIPAMQRRVREIADAYGLTIMLMGHAGDGNVHPTILYDRADPQQVTAMQTAGVEIVRAAMSLGGTITGEHGIGSEKRWGMALRFSPPEIAAMRAVKRAFDPDDLLNPGILLPDPAPDEPPAPVFERRMRHALDLRRAGKSWTVPDDAPAPRWDADAWTCRIDDTKHTLSAGASVAMRTMHNALGAYIAPFGTPDDSTSVGEIVAGGLFRDAVRDALQRATVTLPDDATAMLGGDAVKDVAGYDLKRLVIGGGGAFGRLHVGEFRVRRRRNGA